MALLLSCGCGSQSRAERTVRAYADAWNRGDTGPLARLLAEDATWRIGAVEIAGRERILASLEYDRALNAEFELANIAVRGDTVDCELARSDDLLAAMGLAQVHHYPRFIVLGGVIHEIVPRREPAEMDELRALYGRFAAWLGENDPQAVSQMKGLEGSGALSAESALTAVEKARAWRQAEDE